MRSNYVPFIDRVIDRYEGGYGWDKGDNGGPTKYGITCYDLAEQRGQKMTSMSTWAPIVKAMQRPEAEDIYRKKYAVGDFFDDLNPGADTVVLDYGINSGVSRPLRVAKALLKFTGANQALVGEINRADPDWFIESMCAERLHFMHQIQGGAAWKTFGHGWSARVEDLEPYSKHLVHGGTPPVAPDLSKVTTPKAQHGDPQLGTKATGAAGAGAATTAATHVTNGVPWHLALVMGGVVIIGGFAYYQIMTHRHKAANTTVVLPPGIKPQPGV